MTPFTWRRLAGAAGIYLLAFMVAMGLVVIAMEEYHVRQSYAVQMAVVTLLALFFPAWRYGEDAYSFCAAAAGRLPQLARLTISAFVGWCATVLLFVWTFEPFGRYMDDSEWVMVAKIIVFPWVLAAIVWALYRWAARK